MLLTSTITLIVGILLINILFLCQQRYHFRQIYQVKYGLKVGMAIGNIIKALFSLPLIAVDFVHVFHSKKPTCVLLNLAISYHLHFCTVVFSVTFILLGLELVLRSQPRVSRILNTSVISNVVVLCVPWAAGCVFAIPVSLSNVGWDNYCSYTSQSYIRVTLILCMIAPVTIALIACFFMVCFSTRRVEQENQRITVSGHAANEPMESAVPLKSAEEPEPEGTLATKPVSETGYLKIYQSGSSTLHQDLRITASTTNYGEGSIQEYIFRKEKIILLWSSVILFLSAMPIPCVSLSFYLNDDYRHSLSRETKRLILSALYAIFGMHSFMVPLIWLPIAKL